MNARFIAVGLGSLLLAGLSRAETVPSRPPVEGLTFRVVVVDVAEPRETAARAALRARIVGCLQQTIGAQWRELHAQKGDTASAAKQFKAGQCDAVIFLGAKRPRKLRRLDAVTFGVDLGPERDYEPVYLIVPARELGLQQTILADFPKALAPLHPRTVMIAAR